MSTLKKKYQFRIIFSIVGLIIGLLISAGILNQTKKSQRQATFLYAITGGMLIGIIGGYLAGDKYDTDDYKDEVLGIKKAVTEYYKNGRSWIIQTKSTDSNDKQYLLLTGQDTKNILVSQLNDETIINHEIESGSKVNVEKHHQSARNYVFDKLRAEIKIE